MLLRNFCSLKTSIKPNLEETENVSLGDQECVKEVKISVHLNKSQRKGLIHLLNEYIDVFFWEVSDIVGVSANVVSHKLPNLSRI